MSRLVWDERHYEDGVDQGVLYLASGQGIAWNGLTVVTDDTPSDVKNMLYVDGQRHLVAMAHRDFAGALEAFMYPLEFEPYIGYLDELTAQPRETFGLSYRTQRDEGYRIHLIYNITAEMQGWNTQTVSSSPDPDRFIWKLHTRPEVADGLSPTAHIYVDSTEAHASTLSLFEDLLYGSPSSDPTLPSLAEVITFFDENAIFIVTDHGDGTWTATGPDDMIQMLDATSFQITSPSAIPIDEESYTLSNY